MVKANAYTVNLIIFGMGLWYHYSGETDLIFEGKDWPPSSTSYGKSGRFLSTECLCYSSRAWAQA